MRICFHIMKLFTIWNEIRLNFTLFHENPLGQCVWYLLVEDRHSGLEMLINLLQLILLLEILHADWFIQPRKFLIGPALDTAHWALGILYGRSIFLKNIGLFWGKWWFLLFFLLKRIIKTKNSLFVHVWGFPLHFSIEYQTIFEMVINGFIIYFLNFFKRQHNKPKTPYFVQIHPVTLDHKFIKKRTFQFLVIKFLLVLSFQALNSIPIL
jgi:hypothetical protein